MLWRTYPVLALLAPHSLLCVGFPPHINSKFANVARNNGREAQLSCLDKARKVVHPLTHIYLTGILNTTKLSSHGRMVGGDVDVREEGKLNPDVEGVTLTPVN